MTQNLQPGKEQIDERLCASITRTPLPDRHDIRDQLDWKKREQGGSGKSAANAGKADDKHG